MAIPKKIQTPTRTTRTIYSRVSPEVHAALLHAAVETSGVMSHLIDEIARIHFGLPPLKPVLSLWLREAAKAGKKR